MTPLNNCQDCEHPEFEHVPHFKNEIPAPPCIVPECGCLEFVPRLDYEPSEWQADDDPRWAGDGWASATEGDVD